MNISDKSLLQIKEIMETYEIEQDILEELQVDVEIHIKDFIKFIPYEQRQVVRETILIQMLQVFAWAITQGRANKND